MKPLPIIHAGSPIKTNASINRDYAVLCFKAGMGPADIAAAWPEVFKVTIENGAPKLGMRYDYELGDGSGRYETNRLILRATVTAAIKRFKRKAAHAANT